MFLDYINNYDCSRLSSAIAGSLDSIDFI